MSRFTNLFQAPDPTPVKKVEVKQEVKSTLKPLTPPTTVKVKREETSK
jgi:hypothetical protein